MKKKKNTLSIKLKEEWLKFKEKTGSNQVKTSEALGWSSSFFGKIINGNNDCSYENLLKICNLFEIPPTTIDSSFDTQLLGVFEIYSTTSGNPPPENQKIFRTNHLSRRVIWNDRDLPIQSSSSVALGVVPKNVAIVCSPVPIVKFGDERFPSCEEIIWLILPKRGLIKAVSKRQPPKHKNAEIFRVLQVVFV